MSRDSDAGTPDRKTVEDALARAAVHGRRAASEALLAARALLDALSLALHGAAPEERRILGLAARGLDDLAATISGGAPPTRVLAAIAGALDAEIARWEARAHDDDDARAVLRAYLGLREVLWEFGVRPDRDGAAPRDAARAPSPGRGAGDAARGRRKPPGDRSGRMKRVPVEG